MNTALTFKIEGLAHMEQDVMMPEALRTLGTTGGGADAKGAIGLIGS